MFFADIEDGRLEIVDGAQRIQTLEQFLNGDLVLNNLKILNTLDGFTYNDLPLPQRRKFKSKALRIVVLEDLTSEQRRQEIFNRINTRSAKAKPSEIRRGDYGSPFMKFIIKCSENIQFQKTCPVSQNQIDRREREELILRFFAYSNSYKDFRHDVFRFLDKYLQKHKNDFDKNAYNAEFKNTIEFVNRYFPAGFAKTKTAKTTPRVRFEAIAVGVNLALRENPDLVPKNMNWLDSPKFMKGSGLRLCVFVGRFLKTH